MPEETTENLPPEEQWHVPACGVSRYQLMTEPLESAGTRTIVGVAGELVEHFKAKPETITDVIDILAVERPTNHLLNEIYRHAFHPLRLVAIGEAMICPARTRRAQLQAAFVPVIGAARQVEYVPLPPKPAPRKRKRSVNPETKDFARLTQRVGSNLAYEASYGDEYFPFDLEKSIARHEHVQPAHRVAIMKAAFATVRTKIEWAERELARSKAALATLERESAKAEDREAPELKAAE